MNKRLIYVKIWFRKGKIRYENTNLACAGVFVLCHITRVYLLNYFNENKINNMTIKDLSPQSVWSYFDQINQVPRPSKKEEKIIRFLLDFARQHGLSVQKDDAGNVLIQKPAYKGYENRVKVTLQSHVDMVCEKNKGTNHDFETDPIRTVVQDGWLKAEGTTLGADDGIGVAASLAILADKNMKHGPLEALFTVDEETGLTGAFALQSGFLTGDILINLDTEEEGELYIGCAGGKRTEITFSYQPQDLPLGYTWLQISVKGLNGGHSGSEIDKGLGNANKLLNRVLWELRRKFAIVLAELSGGNLHNAIAREAYALIGVPEKYATQVEQLCREFETDFKKELRGVDDCLQVISQGAEAPRHIMDEVTTEHILNALYACPHGVLGMSRDVVGLVETSSNLASVRTDLENHRVLIVTSQRSSTNSLKDEATNIHYALFTLAGAEVKHTDGYPGWKPNPDSAILQVAQEAYKTLFGHAPKVKAIHAGLECGLFLEKYPHLDMVSCGPTIIGAHSPDEKIEIASVDKWWRLLLKILENIPQDK